MKIAILTFDARIKMYQETLLFFKRYFEVENNVYVFGCSGDLARCTSMTSLGIRVDQKFPQSLRDATCKKCQKHQNELSPNIEYSLNDALDRPNHEQEKILLKVRNMHTSNSSSLLDIHYKDLPVGKLAFYDFAMQNKIDDKTLLQDEELENYTSYLTDCFKVLNFSDRILDSKKLDAIVYVNGNYSLNAVARERFAKNGVRCWSIEYALSHTATKKRVYLEENRLVHDRNWSSFVETSKAYKCNLEDTRAAIQAFRSRFKGLDFNSYSSPKRSDGWTGFDDFKCKYKHLVSIFVSSSDEMRVQEVVYGFEQDKRFFKDQIEWLNYIIDNASPSVGYVIRLHPRLRPNKREKVEAGEYRLIAAALERVKNFPNFFVIEANDPISSYYVLLKSSISIVSWSTMALESVILGVPVIACFPGNIVYPIEAMSPQPGNLNEMQDLIQCRNFIHRDNAHDVEVLRWIAICYHAIGTEILGVRYRKRVSSFIRSIFEGLILKSPHLFRVLAYKKFREPIQVFSSSKEIKIIRKPSQENQDYECLKMLDNFRNEIHGYFG
ncbi:hypothetical protein [Polynucleobacter sp. JS-JIR-II-50]|uniref:hypothetical protein n=1 Tax=Polynucleobacter sp. JS-JIR-II-50 TaxID=2576919 RepID=UPI001BFE68D8|nr:hypothetical protein [Polynucleobacter sp. JS-JIR-II-50]QWE04794.1 hypothetical protein FD963_01725 [Polynucleobacter sp. JS-JIR-II-50]